MGWIFIALGLILIGWGIIEGVNDAVFIARSKTVEGRVVDVERYDKGKAGVPGSQQWYTSDPVSYKRIVEYKVDGKKYRHREDGASSKKPNIGQEIKVFYSEKQPQKCIIDAGAEPWIGPIAITSGILWTALWGGILMLTLRDRQHWRNIAIQGQEIRATASSLEEVTSRDIENNVSKHWRMEFRSITDESTVFVKSYGKRKPRSAPPLGTIVTVFVNPDEPRQYIISI